MTGVAKLRTDRNRVRHALHTVTELADILPRGDARADADMAAGFLQDACDRLNVAIAVTVGLTEDAVQALACWEVLGEYVDHHLTPDFQFAGDKCGCIDDRCIGHHHDETDDCGCLVPCIEAFIEDRDRAVNR